MIHELFNLHINKKVRSIVTSYPYFENHTIALDESKIIKSDTLLFFYNQPAFGAGIDLIIQCIKEYGVPDDINEILVELPFLQQDL